ncbi:hypothetical protein C0214_18450 [Methylobacterium sp. DM1]|nr:hypothetical protein C0214_18450 [Methylobacterium sp. DM1]
MIHSIRHASAVLAAPSSAVRYFRNFNNNVHYHNPGIDIDEAPTSRDIAAFYSVHVDRNPFVLVLGRKAGAKNYRWIIESALQQNLRVVMVGPDDDGMAISEPNVTYLGPQPRNVVRGALASCLFLANMSSSESFGMVIIEAWLAKRAVIANRECAAFQDIIKDGENGLLVSRSELSSAMSRLSKDHKLRRELGEAGLHIVSRYDWSSIGREFEQICNDAILNFVN